MTWAKGSSHGGQKEKPQVNTECVHFAGRASGTDDTAGDSPGDRHSAAAPSPHFDRSTVPRTAATNHLKAWWLTHHDESKGHLAVSDGPTAGPQPGGFWLVQDALSCNAWLISTQPLPLQQACLVCSPRSGSTSRRENTSKQVLLRLWADIPSLPLPKKASEPDQSKGCGHRVDLLNDTGYSDWGGGRMAIFLHQLLSSCYKKKKSTMTLQMEVSPRNTDVPAKHQFLKSFN